ncbi:MAG: SBBP repeat-containing protein, partial [Nitratireductor sp.]
SIEVDSSGNSYVTGYFQGTVDFDPGAGTTNLTSAGVKDVFIAKYNSDGTLDWAKNVGGTSDDVSYSISVDSSGNSYVTGTFQGTADFDPGAGTTNLTSAGNDDAFIAKYDSDGALVWAKNVGGTSDDYGQSIEVDSSGNSYVTGYFQGTADFDPGAGTANLTSAGSSDVFLLKLDSDGNLVSAVAQTPGGGSSGGGSSGGGLTVTDQTSEDVTGTATGRTLVNNTGDTATGALVSNTGNGNTVTATLPSGVSLTTSGTSAALPGSTAGTTLTGEIRANEEEVSQQSFLDGHGQTFITNSGDMALDIRSISFSSASTTAETVKITGDDGAANGSEAFVINTSGLPASSNIVLDNIEFAAIVGQAFVTGGAGQNYVVGDDAVQFISLGAGDDTLAGGGGNDSIGSGIGEDIIYGNQGDDLVFGGEGKDTLYGGQNNDTAVGGSGDDVLHGNKGNDILYGNQSNDTLSGGENEDILFGGQGNDLLSGGSGDDFLAGNKGDDILVGGDGADTFAFYYSGGNDQVSDFTVGTDTLMLEDGLGVSDGTETDGNTTITFSDGGTLTVMGVSKA